MEKLVYKEASYKVIGIAMKIHTELGNGFLEKVYENAMMMLLNKENIKAEQQKYLKLKYSGENIGNYIDDILVGDKIIVELKTVEKITEIHIAQVINYLKITGKKLEIILNFKNSKLEYRRVVPEKNIRENSCH